MLPFLKRKKEDGIANLIIKNRTPDKTNESEDLDKEYTLEDCAQDILDAVSRNDKTALASALKEAFQKLDASPHVEGEHISPHTYESQKED